VYVTVQVLLSLPGMTPSALEQFDGSLKRSGSPKEQRAVFRTLLLGLGGNQLKALACQRSTTTITNVSGKSLTPCTVLYCIVLIWCSCPRTLPAPYLAAVCY